MMLSIFKNTGHPTHTSQHIHSYIYLPSSTKINQVILKNWFIIILNIIVIIHLINIDKIIIIKSKRETILSDVQNQNISLQKESIRSSLPKLQDNSREVWRRKFSNLSFPSVLKGNRLGYHEQQLGYHVS